MNEIQYKEVTLQNENEHLFKFINRCIFLFSIGRKFLKSNRFNVWRAVYQRGKKMYIIFFSDETDISINYIKSNYYNYYIFWSKKGSTQNTKIFKGCYYKAISIINQPEEFPSIEASVKFKEIK